MCLVVSLNILKIFLAFVFTLVVWLRFAYDGDVSELFVGSIFKGEN